MTDIKDLYNLVLQDIIAATHCVGCGEYSIVCLRGYVGEYCCKGCWRYSYEECEDYDACSLVSLANSKYHDQYHRSISESHSYWPMREVDVPCYNECILSRETIRIPGYNYFPK
jgi:hypothetical protein